MGPGKTRTENEREIEMSEITLTQELKEAFFICLPLHAFEEPNSIECWPWMMSNGSFYGQLYFKGKNYYTHRLSYTIFKGEIPEGLIIRHTCDNPCCVNPRHLILGTKSDNTLDALKRNRLPNHSLTEQDVIYIKTKIKEGIYYGLMNELAFKFNVNRKAIYKIKAGITWKHIKV